MRSPREFLPLRIPFLSLLFWAAAYVLLDALPDRKIAMLHSLSAVTSYGHANLYLASYWEGMDVTNPQYNHWLSQGGAQWGAPDVNQPYERVVHL
jgi:hypothetical protein